MQTTSENLVVVTRDNESSDNLDVLVGRKKRGRFAGYDIFPGGKADGTELQPVAAARELGEETGIWVAPETLRSLGGLLIQDYRPGKERFGNVALYVTHVSPDIEAVETDELEPLWRPIDQPGFAENMPPDICLWWPMAQSFNYEPLTTHIIYDEQGNTEMITKRPNFAHDMGRTIISGYHWSR